MTPRFKVYDNPTTTAFQFLQTEVSIGKVFAKIALKSTSLEKIARNRSRARLAHDTVLRFLEKVPLTQPEWQDIHDLLQDLKADLNRLGEVF